MGNFKLHQTFFHVLIVIHHWTATSEEQREKLFSRFLKDKGKNHPNVTVFQDRSRTSRSLRKQEKDGQRKRPLADRTCTPNSEKDNFELEVPIYYPSLVMIWNTNGQ